ncbi:MAG: hypothetical protein QF489_07860 [Planctomycetota bacterium]|jgi:hypothetical protein|nr:hypothetical protein [Planctomycetota bacterium]
MKHLFYPLAAILLMPLALNSCGDEPMPDDPGQSGERYGPETQVFNAPGTVLPPYELPAEDAWVQRYASNLKVGTKESHRFAAERLAEFGAEASAVLSAEIRAHLARPASMGYLVSLCNAFTTCSDPHHADALMDLVELTSTPVVRTAAFEAIGRSGAKHLVPRLLVALKKEVEASPRGAGLFALAKLGTQEGIDFLEARVSEWVDPDDGIDSGQSAWNALLSVDDPAVSFALQRLESRLAPFPSLQAYGMRIHFGERALADKVRPYLNEQEYPSAGTRTLALQLLGELGDWDSVLAQRDSQEYKIQESLIGLLRRPDAIEGDIGVAILDDFAENALDSDLRYNAMEALVERGQTQRLDPYLRQVRKFPTGKGSVDALRLLARPGFADPRTDPILLSRWKFAEGSYRIDLLRGLTQGGSAEGARFLADRAMDPKEDQHLRETAMTILANFGEQSVPLFLEIYDSQPGVWAAVRIIPGLGKYAEHPDARAKLLHFARSPQVEDRVRHLALGLLPRIFRGEAATMLMEIRGQEERADVVKYIEGLLHEYY